MKNVTQRTALTLMVVCVFGYTYISCTDDAEKRNPVIHSVADINTSPMPSIGYCYDGNTVQLSDGSKPTFASKIIVHDNVVYIAGLQFTGTSNNSVAILWKDGIPKPLNDGTTHASASGIAVSGADVYVSITNDTGPNKHIAMYWKNSVATALPSEDDFAFANDIYVDGQDVYVVGNERINFGPSIAQYWKNGVPVRLSNGTTNTYAYGIVVSGSDVYVYGKVVPGNNTAIPFYWKNGQSFPLTNGTTITDANDMAVSGKDVYVAGTKYPSPTNQGTSINLGKGVAVYWKNGEEVILTSSARSASANGIFVLGQDVYVTGFEENEVGIAIWKYWKNGIEVLLSDATNQAVGRSIYVVE